MVKPRAFGSTKYQLFYSGSAKNTDIYAKKPLLKPLALAWEKVQCLQQKIIFFTELLIDQNMAKPKFFTLFNTLSKEEISSFGKYLKRMHGNDTVSLEVFDHLRKQQDEKKRTLDYLCRKLYPSGPEAARKNLQNSLSDLYLWLKDFLLFTKATGNEYDGQLLWLKILKERKLDPEFVKHAQALQTETTKLAGESTAAYLKMLTVNKLIHYYRPVSQPLPRAGALLQFKKELDLFHALAQLRVACELVNLKNQRLQDIDLQNMQLATIDVATAAARNEPPLLLLYRAVYRLIASNEEQSYSTVIKMLTKHAKNIDPLELHTLLSYLHNYAAAQIRDGKEEYWTSTHLLNKFGVEQGVFTRDGGISASQFCNIVAVAGQVKDFSWTNAFLSSHSRFLPIDSKDETIILAKTIVSFEKKEFKKVIGALQDMDFKNFLNSIRARALILRSMYEMQDDENETLDYCLTLESYLRRNRQAKREAVRGTLNTVQIIKMLIRKKSPQKRILKTIEEMHNVYFKSWLLEKAKLYVREG